MKKIAMSALLLLAAIMAAGCGASSITGPGSDDVRGDASGRTAPTTLEGGDGDKIAPPPGP